MISQKDTPTTLYGKLLKSMMLFGSAQFVSVLVSLVKNKFIALFLGPWGMGIISLYNAALNLLSLITGFGIGTSGTREISSASLENQNQSVKRVRSWSWALGLFGMVMCCMLSPLLSQWSFNDNNHVFSFMMLSFVVFFTIVGGGEFAVLRGIGATNKVALAGVWGCVLSAITSLPLIFILGERCIVPMLFVASLTTTLAACHYSYKQIELQGTLSYKYLINSRRLLQLGVSFVLASGVGCLADFVVRIWIERSGGLEEVGLFSASYMTVLSIGGLVFATLESDYYPQISGLRFPSEHGNVLINEQIEILLFIISPLIIGLIYGLPIIVPLLFSDRFVAMQPTMQIMLLALYIRALKLPLAYVALSQGRGKHYSLLEAFYYIIFVSSVCLGYLYGGLNGAGYGVMLTAGIDMITLLIYCKWIHSIRLRWKIYGIFLLQFAVGAVSVYIIRKSILTEVLQVVIGLLLVAAGLVAMLSQFNKKTHKQKF